MDELFVFAFKDVLCLAVAATSRAWIEIAFPTTVSDALPSASLLATTSVA
jgi:hypothetical protein